MGFILGILVGVVVTGLAFIVFYKNNMNKITKAREEILAAYKSAHGEEVATKAEEIFNKIFKR